MSTKNLAVNLLLRIQICQPEAYLSLRELTGRRVKRFNKISVKRKKKYTYAYRFLGTQTHTKKGKKREDSYRMRSLLPQSRNILRVGRPLFLQN